MKHLKHALWALLIPLALSACSSVTPNAPATLETQATTLTVTHKREIKLPDRLIGVHNLALNDSGLGATDLDQTQQVIWKQRFLVMNSHLYAMYERGDGTAYYGDVIYSNGWSSGSMVERHINTNSNCSYCESLFGHLTAARYVLVRPDGQIVVRSYTDPLIGGGEQAIVGGSGTSIVGTTASIQLNGVETRLVSLNQNTLKITSFSGDVVVQTGKSIGRLMAMAYGADDVLYLFDYENLRILKFDTGVRGGTRGAFLGTFDLDQTKPAIKSMTVDPAGNVYIGSDNGGFHIYGSDGQWKQSVEGIYQTDPNSDVYFQTDPNSFGYFASVYHSGYKPYMNYYASGLNDGNGTLDVRDASGYRQYTITAPGQTPPIQITAEPQSQATCLTSATNLSVVADADQSLTYQWRKNGVNLTDGATISGATTESLNISSTLSDDAGYYDVLVRKSDAIVTSQAAIITVTPAPVITDPADQTVNSGESAEFTAAASGAQTVQWQVSTDGGANFSDIAGANDETLTLSSVASSQNGNQYRAVFTGSCSNPVMSNAATLTVGKLAQTITFSISPFSATAGSGDVTLTVNGSGFIESSVVRWNGQDLATSYLSASQLSATVPNSLLTTVATAEVTVFNPPLGGSSNVQAFFITQASTGVSYVDSASSDSPTDTAVAEVAGVVKAEATGTGTVVVAQYSSNPGGTPSFSSGGSYFDVYLGTGHSFSEVIITLCGTGNLAYWWNGSSWLLASNQSYSDPCATFTVNSTTSPSLTDLHGTEFALGSKTDQTISFADDTPANKTVGDPDFTVSASATSGLTVTFAAKEGSTCSVSAAGLVSNLTAGTCTIVASQAGDTNYNAAANVEHVITIARAALKDQTIDFTSTAPTDAVYGGEYTPAATATSKLTVTFGASDACSYDSGTGKVTMTGAGECTVTADQAGDDDYNAAPQAPQVFPVAKAATTTNVSVNPSSQQYSDLVTLSASVSSLVAGTQSGTVQFMIDGDDAGSAQISNGRATLSSYQVTQAPRALPHSVTAVFTSTNANFTGSNSAAQLTVTQEDARATYAGLPLVNTSSATATSANVVLKATIQDISAVDSSDANAGDIGKAKVSFVNRDSGAVLCSDLTPSSTGIVECDATLNVVGTSGATTYTIGIVVEGYYTRNDSSENTVVVVAQPINGMISGGGHLITSSSAGQYAGGNGLKTNFGFNVKYNKSMTSLQGNVNIIVRASNGKVYQIKANSMTSLLTKVATGTGNFVSKANLTDVTNALSPVPLGGNYTLQITMKDNGNPGSTDTLGITLRDSGGALLFSSNWSGTNTREQTLNGGNLVVR